MVLELGVELGARSYPIVISSGLISKANYFDSFIASNQVMIITNDIVAPLYLKKVTSVLDDGYQVKTLILPDGESYKTLEVLNRIYTALLENRFNRDCTLIALGGGVVGDVAGFAAASYQRGVDFIQVPTTLLAQVDSSVGGKTGVNHPLGKNMIGAFHQPQAVVIDTDTLDTLPDREFSAGLAEVIKYGLINDLEFYQWLEENNDRLLGRDQEAIAYAIERSCRDKAALVAADEKEAGQRALLNLGHTFGHAIEVGTGYGTYLHGEAVAIGICMAAELSARMGWIDKDDVRSIKALITNARLPSEKPVEMTGDRFLELMAIDKKVQDNVIRLVLMKSLGKAFITSDFDRDLLRAVVS